MRPLPLTTRLGLPLMLLLIAWLGMAPRTWAEALDRQDVEVASVVVDGRLLLRLRGTSSIPAPERAANVTRRIENYASDESLDPNNLTLVQDEGMTWVADGLSKITAVVPADAQIEKMDWDTYSQMVLLTIKKAINEYRRERSAPVFAANLGKAISLTFGIIALFWIAFKLKHWLGERAQARVRQQIDQVEVKTGQVLHSATLLQATRSLGNLVFNLSLALSGYLYLNAVLSLFPITRGTATLLLRYLADPLASIGHALLDYLPNFFYLVIIYFIFRYLLKLLHALFGSLATGRIRWNNFDQEWAWPTYRLVRLGMLAFGLVVAYPYLPGSDSAAFKGVSIFLGVLASIGSSSIISNMIAGYSMTYRRAFRVGDRIRIGDNVGDVTEMRLLVTHLRTPKNEEVVIPNSVVLNSEVVNYSSMAKESGLILHTTVGIGYETPWRQVEAMLLMAAKRTPGIMTNREAFVLKRELGDFAVTYELNVYVDNTAGIVKLYSALHANILDVFNEYGVAIMTPAYEGDPEQPKMVSKDQWYAAPAKAPHADKPAT